MWHCGRAIFFKSAGFHALRIIVRFILQLVDDARNLVNALPRVVCVCIIVFRPKMPPLKAIYRPKISFLTVRQPHAVQKLTTTIVIPYFDSLFRKRFRRRGSSRELEQFCDDGAKTHFVVRRGNTGVGAFEGSEDGRDRELHAGARIWSMSPCQFYLIGFSILEDVVNEVEILVFLVLIHI